MAFALRLPARTLLIAAGAVVLARPATAQVPGPIGQAEFERRTSHWAWQPLQEVAPPAAGHPVDAFVDARLRAQGLQRSPPAAPHQQLRRLWFDLVGLPPSPAVVAAFVRDPSDAAWLAAVRDLLASPHFGECQARHWLDLVRYAETLGHEYDFEIPNAWRYRDYVIRACNGDVPYDQFVREHLAGDLLPQPRRDAQGNNESVQATAAFWFVEQTHSPVDAGQHQADRIDNQVDVLGKSLLGMTVACARCHDHKFDAIRASDYYALAGFVQSSRFVQAPLRPCEVTGSPYREALAAQRRLAAAWAEHARGEGWPRYAASEPTAWARGDAPALRADEQLIAWAGDDAGWTTVNDGFGEAPWCGPFCPDPRASPPQLFVLPGPFWLSSAAGPGREGTLQTPTFTLSARYVHVRAAGSGSRLKLIVDGLHVVRDPIYGELHKGVDDPTAHWVTFDTGQWPGRPAFLQAIDQRTPDLGDPERERSSYPGNAWLAVQAVVLSPHTEPPAAAECTPLPPPGWDSVPPPVAVAIDELRAAVHALPVSPTVPSLGDGTGADGHVFVRGDHRRPGAPAPRRFLQALAGDAPLATGPGSGRLALADAVLSPTNPLLARVFVNRLWHHLFGRGLVKTVDNLGALGEAPSHPELLDWLAAQAQRTGWSRKAMIELLVTSATYRQASASCPDAAAIDPNNALLHRAHVRRLPAEAVRDALLCISGRLDPTLYGPSIELPKSAIVKARGEPNRKGPLDGGGRRSIYLAMRRNFLPPMLLAFDLPTPFATVGARSSSNVPAQALALANDPFVHQQCRRWAESLRSAPDDDARLAAAFLQCFGRAPEPTEATACRDFLAGGGDEPDGPWFDLLHTLVNTAEFLYLR